MGCDRVKRGAGAKPFAISIHASRMGCDDTRCKTITLSSDFNPRIPYGMRLVCWSQARPVEFISIHASRMGCDLATSAHRTRAGISIHASRMGCDMFVFYLGRTMRISIHASRMGCDQDQGSARGRRFDFNPRIPYGMRPETNKLTAQNLIFQSTHPVWDATFQAQPLYADHPISIHASRMGCDLKMLTIVEPSPEFQSTHPVWDAT